MPLMNRQCFKKTLQSYMSTQLIKTFKIQETTADGADRRKQVHSHSWDISTSFCWSLEEQIEHQ